MGMNAVSYTTPVFPIDLQRSEGEKLVSCEFYLLDISLIQSVSREIKKNEHIETVWFNSIFFLIILRSSRTKSDTDRSSRSTLFTSNTCSNN